MTNSTSFCEPAQAEPAQAAQAEQDEATPADTVEAVLNECRAEAPNAFSFETLRRGLASAGFSFIGADTNNECYTFRRADGLNLFVYPVIFYSMPAYFHVFNWNITY